MSSGWGRRSDAWLVALVCSVPVVLMAFDWRFHEFWRDEAQAFTIARDVPLDELYGQVRTQGHPPLYFLLLKATSVVLASPLPLLVLGWFGNSALLLGTYLLLHSISGGDRRASLVVTLCFALTYAYAYELGVVVRQYALGLGFALMCFAYLREALRRNEARREVWLGTAAGALAALTSAHAACVSGGAMLVFGVMMLFRRGGLRNGWPTLVALPFFALALYMASPYPDRYAQANADAHHGIGFVLGLAPQLFAAGSMPSDWWRVEYLPVAEPWSAHARRFAFIFLGVAFVLGAATRAASNLARRPLVELYCPLAIVVGWIPLLEVVVNHHYGFYRHHVHFAVPALVMMAGWGIDSSLDHPAIAVLRRLSLFAMAPWFLFGHLMAAANLSIDLSYPFSDTKQHALALPFGAHVVANTDEYVALLAWRPDLLFRSTVGRGRHVRWQPFDRAWHDTVPAGPLVREECEAAPGDVFVTSEQMAPLRCLTMTERPLSSLPMRPFNRETFGLWHVDCGCVLAR
jgi:hypothetical protein